MHEQLALPIEAPRPASQPAKPATMQERYGCAQGARCGDCALSVDNVVFDFVGPIKAFPREVMRCGVCLQKVKRTTQACRRFAPKQTQEGR